MSNWTEIAKLEDIPRLGSRVLTTDTMNIALFRTATDEVFAIRVKLLVPTKAALIPSKQK
jgi:nitrite reductase (NADH) small subunit